MGLKMDFSQASQGGDIEPGVYECVISHFGFDSFNDREFIKFDLIVRNDVQQKYQNKHIFDNFYPKKDTGEYSMGFLYMVGKAAHLEDGKEYADLQAMLADYAGHPVLLTIANETYNGKTRPRIKNWAESKFPQVQHKWKDGQPSTPTAGPSPFANDGQPVDISDDDLPF